MIFFPGCGLDPVPHVFQVLVIQRRYGIAIRYLPAWIPGAEFLGIHKGVRRRLGSVMGSEFEENKEVNCIAKRNYAGNGIRRSARKFLLAFASILLLARKN